MECCKVEHIPEGKATDWNDGFKCDSILENHSCSNCDFRTDLQIFLRDHSINYYRSLKYYRKIDTRIQRFTCRYCDYASYSLFVWRLHERKCSKMHVLKDGNNRLNSCTSGTVQNVPLQQNNVSQNAASTAVTCFNCDQCSYKTEVKSDIREHIKLEHTPFKNFYNMRKKLDGEKTMCQKLDEEKTMRQKFDGEKTRFFNCDKRKHRYKCKSAFEEHIRTKHMTLREVEHKCKQCSFRTFFRETLDQHIIDKHKSVRSNLKTRVQDKKPFHCTWEACTWKFAKYEGLKRHYRIHTGQKPYHCPWDGCTWKFARSDKLTLHIRSKHTEQKSFVCSLCTRSFSRADVLSNHKRKCH